MHTMWFCFGMSTPNVATLREHHYKNGRNEETRERVLKPLYIFINPRSSSLTIDIQEYAWNKSIHMPVDVSLALLLTPNYGCVDVSNVDY